MEPINVEALARLCHEANKLYCESMGDFSQVPWEEAPENTKESARNGVRFHLANPNVTPEESHENWLKFKTADGWKYGPVKDEAKKEHPCFMPFKDLPPEQQKKDAIFGTIVKALVR